jgi:hypothetical protein
MMPPNNAGTVAPGNEVSLPDEGPSSGITNIGPGTFLLPNVGTYDVAFSVSVDEPGQLVLVLTGLELPYTVYGKATATSEITGDALIQTTTPGSLLSLNNPTGDTVALTITPFAGGAQPVAASITITELN